MFALPATFLLSASLFSPFHKVVRVDPLKPADQRISFSLRNDSRSFHDLRIDGHTYTVPPKQGLTIKAPVGTIIYADSRFSTFQPGDTIVIVNASLQNARVEMP